MWGRRVEVAAVPRRFEYARTPEMEAWVLRGGVREV
jgi:hypothetical protein